MSHEPFCECERQKLLTKLAKHEIWLSQLRPCRRKCTTDRTTFIVKQKGERSSALSGFDLLATIDQD
jgi:hypothetical protein